MLIFTVLCTNHFNPCNPTTCLMKLFPPEDDHWIVLNIFGIHYWSLFGKCACVTNVVCDYFVWS